MFIFVRRRTENTNAICEKTAGLRSGNFSDLNSACSKMLVTVKIFQFHDMLNESERYRVTANGLHVHSQNSRMKIEVENISLQNCSIIHRPTLGSKIAAINCDIKRY